MSTEDSPTRPVLAFPDDRAVLGDGGISTALQALGLEVEGLPELQCLTHPAQVAAVHRAFAAAGAGWTTTNTFGAHRERLARFGAADRLAEICAAAVRCAREGAPRLPVLGSIGPASCYRETVEALAAAGVDGFRVETVVALPPGQEAVRAAVAAGLGPVIAGFTPGEDGNLLDGTPLETAARALFQAGAAAVGVNCGSGPEGMLGPARRLIALQEGPVLVAPNAGLPRMTGGRAAYALPPARFAEAAIEFEELGARLIAGCCGVAPEHIRAAFLALRGDPPEE